MNAIKWKNALFIILILAAAISIVNWFVGNRIFTIGFVIDCISQSVSVITILTGLFCTYFWKLKIFRKWLVLVPDLNGEWRGGIDSDWIHPDTKQKLPNIVAKLTIKQTLFKTSCIIETNESSSRSMVANFVMDPDNQKCQLVYTYQNDPKQTIQDRSRIHYGTAILEIQEAKKAILLKGNYWTSRNTGGYMAFSSRQKSKKKKKESPFKRR